MHTIRRKISHYLGFCCTIGKKYIYTLKYIMWSRHHNGDYRQ